MRLTLRTLLAYLDDILEPQDAKELAEKIEDSEFASGLVHRIRSSVGRVRLSSPQVLGHGVGTDPNSVAEYLDNTLPPDRFPEFEKVCLESDTHLSEVASCHQILALVLGEPSQFEASLRQRMYELPQTGRRPSAPEMGRLGGAAATHDRSPTEDVLPMGAPGISDAAGLPGGSGLPGDTGVKGGSASTGRPGSSGGGGDSGVESELEIASTVARPASAGSTRSGWLWPLTAALVVGLLATWGFVVAMGPLDRDHPLVRVLGMNANEVAPGAAEDVLQEPEGPVVTEPVEPLSPGALSPGALSPGALSPGEGYLAPDLGRGQAARDSAAPSPAAVAGDGIEETLAPGTFPSEEAMPDPLAGFAQGDLGGDAAPPAVERAPLDPDAIQPLDEGLALDAAPALDDGAHLPLEETRLKVIPPEAGIASPATAADLSTSDAGESIFVGPSDLAPRVDDAAAPAIPELAADTPPGVEPVVGGGAEDGEDLVAPPQLQNIGRFISDREVLAIADEAASWLRLRPRSSLNVGDWLVALPSYRPKLLLATDLQMTLEGGTSLSILEPFDGQTLTIEIQYGRAVLIPVGRDTPALGLAFGDRIGTVTFADADSELAIEVRHERLAGTDPQQPAHLVVRMWATSGRVQWKGADDATAKTLEAGQLYLFVDDGPGHFLDVALPEWAGDRRPSDSMAMASRALEPQMGVDRSITLALAEAVEDRRVEVRALAARCLSYLDRFEPLIQTLNDPSQRAWWTHQIDALHEALARSPAVADQVSQDLAKARGARGNALYRLLWGYSPEDLQAGGNRALIEYLDSEDLDFRVLGFDNLQRITGAHLMYQPWYTAARRRGSVVKWRKRDAEGLIVHRSPPVIAAELESVR